MQNTFQYDWSRTKARLDTEAKKQLGNDLLKPVSRVTTAGEALY